MYVTEIKTAKVMQPCSEGVMLRWENDWGGVDQWVFSGNIVHMPTVSKHVYFDKQIDELKNTVSNFEAVSKEYDKTLRLHTSFDKNNAAGFEHLIRSRNIWMWDGAAWLRVDVIPETFQNEKEKGRGRLKIKVVLNRTYIK